MTIAIVTLALNLRPMVNSVGSLLPEIRTELGMTGTVGGALTALPGLCFALMGLLAPGLAVRFGPVRVVAVGVAAMTAGQFVRLIGASVPALFGGSIVALAGLAVCNVLMPSLVRRFFPDRIPTMTAVYTTSLAIGATSGSALTVPIERGLDGGWQTGLGVWAFVAVIALVPWVAMVLQSRPGDAVARAAAIQVRTLLGSRVAWKMCLYFGLQSAQAYIVTFWLSQILVDAGMDLKQSGYAIATFAAIGIPLSALVPTLVSRPHRIAALILALGCGYLLGYLGLLIDPAGGIWVWVVLLGIGSGAFPLALTLLALRARTAEGVAALSAFTQCIGYLLAGAGPFAFGALHDLTGSWTVPIIALMACAAGMIIVGLRVAKTQFVEDDLARS